MKLARCSSRLDTRLPEWLYEEGIGENRAIFVDDNIILDARIEWAGELRPGSIHNARLAKILVPGKRGIAALPSGEELLVEPLPRQLTEGASINVEVMREAIPERGRPKMAKARVTELEPRPSPALLERLRGTGAPVTELSFTGPDLFERAGWSELLDEAATGEIAFPCGSLRMNLTPAMTLFDVDGALPPADLAAAGAAAAARTIRRFDIGGSIGIDLPTLPSKEDRQRSATAFDNHLPQPFERTAVNGFGFLQIVRRRERVSIPERVQVEPAGAAARALLRLAERTPGTGPKTLIASPAVTQLIEQHPEWLDMLARRVGTAIVLQPQPGLAISAGHVHSQFN